MSDLLKIEIDNAIAVLKKGGTILYPTDTIWGIGCDATNKRAVEKVCFIKKRKKAKYFILLLHRIEQLFDYVKEVPPAAIEVMQQIKTPLTIVYPGAINLPKNIIADDGSIAIRIVKEEFCCQLLSKFSLPIVSSSANVSGASTPLFFSQISPEIINAVDYVVKFKQTKIEQLKPSSIITFNEQGGYEVIRQ